MRAGLALAQICALCIPIVALTDAELAALARTAPSLKASRHPDPGVSDCQTGREVKPSHDCVTIIRAPGEKMNRLAPIYRTRTHCAAVRKSSRGKPARQLRFGVFL